MKKGKIVTENYFFCYDAKLMGVCKRAGFDYITCAIHEASGNKFWLFERTPELQEVIINYRTNKLKGE